MPADILQNPALKNASPDVRLLLIGLAEYSNKLESQNAALSEVIHAQKDMNDFFCSVLLEHNTRMKAIEDGKAN